jgi:hypothetical protein
MGPKRNPADEVTFAFCSGLLPYRTYLCRGCSVYYKGPPHELHSDVCKNSADRCSPGKVVLFDIVLGCIEDLFGKQEGLVTYELLKQLCLANAAGLGRSIDARVIREVRPFPSAFLASAALHAVFGESKNKAYAVYRTSKEDLQGTYGVGDVRCSRACAVGG